MEHLEIPVEEVMPRIQSMIIEEDPGAMSFAPDNDSVGQNQSQMDRSNNLSQKSAFNEMVDELHNINCLYHLSLGSVQNFSNQLKMTKLFLNMVIHDFRNPTTSIKTGLE